MTSTSSTMPALLLDAPAEPQDLPAVLRLAEVPLPQPGPGQVRLRVRACGPNLVD